MTRRTFRNLVPSLLLPCMPLWAQDAKTVLQNVTETYQSLRSYYFEGKTLSESTIKGQTTRSETGFVAAFEAPDKFRLEFRYPTAGNWLRVSDGASLFESRSLTKESHRSPVTPTSIWVLKSSPHYNFQRLSETARNPVLVRSDALSIDGKQVDCYLISFESHRRELRDGESAGTSMVWVSKDKPLVLREEISTTSLVGGERSESKRTTTIERFRIDEGRSGDLFSTAGHPR